MTMLIYDVKKREKTDVDPLGLSGFISWHRLAILLQQQEAIRGEQIGHLVIGERGIDIRYE